MFELKRLKGSPLRGVILIPFVLPTDVACLRHEDRRHDRGSRLFENIKSAILFFTVIYIFAH